MAVTRSKTALRSVRRRPTRLALALLSAVVVVVGLSPAVPAAAASPVPGGYRVVASEALGPGVEHQTLRQEEPRQDVHVARLAPGTAGRLLPVLARDVLTGPSAGPEPTSSMCARVKCVAAVNADYSDGAGRPVGAMVAAGELLTTPGMEHMLFRIDGKGVPTVRPGLDWSARVATADGQAVPVQAVNRPLSGEGIALYSRRWGPSTATEPGTTEVSLQLPATSTGVLPTGPSAVRVGAAQGGGNVPIPAGQVVLSGRGAGARALAELAQRAAGAAVLDVSAGGLVSAVGGSPQLLSKGKVAYPADNRDSFTQGRHPRTVVGITPSGETLLVTADGRGASAGLTLAEATRLLTGLGAVDAMNLDGGGSTTFVAGGSVRNVPSDGQERSVVSALTVMPGGPVDPLASLLTQVTDALNGLLKPPA